MRYLPQSENGGAGQMWNKWCDKHDGGKGNGQYKDEDSEYLNTDLVKPLGKPIGKHLKKNGDTTTTYVTHSAEFKRAIFSIEFDFKGSELGEEPSDKNDWGLRVNPCWPEAIVPDDPGWVLLTGDGWYVTKMPQMDTKRYSRKPSDDLVEAAENWLEARQNKIPGGGKHGPIDPPKRAPSDDGKGPANKAPKKGGNSSRRRRRYLDLAPNGALAVRDDDFNVTRPLTPEEVKRDVEIVRCADKDCSIERKIYEQEGEEDILILPGEAPRMSSPQIVEATATKGPVVPRREATGIVQSIERKAASQESPERTAAPAPIEV